MGTPAISEKEHAAASVSSVHEYLVPIIGFVLGLCAFVSLFVVALPKALRGLAESQLSSALAQRVEIKNLNLNILSGRVELDGLRISSTEHHTELLVVRQINIDIDVPTLLKRELSLKHLEILSPEVSLIRGENARWNLPALGDRQSPSDSKTGIPITIQQAVLRDGSLIIEDRSTVPAHTEHLDDIQLTLTDVTPSSSNPAKVHGFGKITESGTIAIDGSVQSDFHGGNLTVDLTNVSLTPAHRMLRNQLHVQGRVTSHLSMIWPGKDKSSIWIAGPIKGQDVVLASAGRVMGQAATVVIPKAEVIWPQRVVVDRLELSQPQMWIRRAEKGRFVGFQDGASDSPKSERAMRNVPSGSTTSTAWYIGMIVVRDGLVHIEDRSVTPVYSDVLQNLDMTLSDVRSTPSQPVRIAARADIASGGTLNLNGHVDLLGPTPKASLKATIHRLVVPSTNSYLERIVSHYTTNGTLTSTMDIQLTGDRLDVRSDVTLADLHVEPIDNSTRRTVQEQIGLPLGFLIALLKDDSGRIIVTLPISGPLSNPTFDWTDAIWASIRKAVVNLISLPIRSIGRLVMGDNPTDEVRIDPITFPPGSLTLNDKMERRLQHLAKLLHTTDRMALHITPILNAVDLEALQRVSRESWPVPNVDTAETARHLLAVRRAYLVATRLAGLQGVPSTRLPVDLPKTDISERTQGRVDLKLQ